MASYRLYYLKGAGLVGSDLIEADSDFEATRLARPHAIGQRVEIWQGAQRVRTLGPLSEEVA